MQRAEMVELITYAAALWPSYSMPAGEDAWRARTTAWFDVVGDLPRAAADAALQSLAVDGREHAPPPGVIRRRAVDLIDPAGVAPKLDKAISEIFNGSNAWADGWKWTHPAIADTVASVGLWNLRHSENQETLRAQLRDLYRAAVDRHNEQRYSTPSVTALVAASMRTPELSRG